jgi:hypothetical protein
LSKGEHCKPLIYHFPSFMVQQASPESIEAITTNGEFDQSFVAPALRQAQDRLTFGQVGVQLI